MPIKIYKKKRCCKWKKKKCEGSLAFIGHTKVAGWEHKIIVKNEKKKYISGCLFEVH